MKLPLKVFAVAAIAAASFAQAASAAPSYFKVDLSGPNESPPNTSPATGWAQVTIDPVTNLMTVDVNFEGLVGTTTASHIHCCTSAAFTGTAGVATTTPNFAGFPLGVTSGSYSVVLDMTLASSYNPAFITANGNSIATAESVLFAGIIAGKAYLNIHSSFKPGGEIRGFLVPEPASLSLFGFGAIAMGAVRRRRSRASA